MKKLFTAPTCDVISLGNETIVTSSNHEKKIDADDYGIKVDLPDMDIPAIGFPSVSGNN